ncbi:hypothetical protein [Bacillus suaedaesalsae]|uniref:DUF4179 domain-containing protein n=1 Tax=Bacillus suaedaesalsae TaxID=2810349 RepID=A0ABS2DDA5_9BACI|nr:hypothetical protein [Bacillus suaedaesalsae]MBM6616424.1 hypothetical protein [Bacillus suaedaesalsae]
MEDLHNQLKRLPKHSLSSEQKQRIQLNLNNKNVLKKPREKFVAIVSLVMVSMLFSIFAITELQETHKRGSNLVGIQEGKVFNSDSTELFGIEGKIGLIGITPFVAEDLRRVSKIIVLYWDNSEELAGKDYRIEATNIKNEKLILSEGILNSPMGNESANALMSFNPFPKEGIWLLSFYVEDQLFEEFTLDVLPPFPKTKHYTLTSSPKELIEGEEVQFSIESSWKEKNEIEVKLMNEKKEVVDLQTFHHDALYYDAKTGDPIYSFTGTLTFPNKGTWKLEIDGEVSNSFTN